MVASVLVAAITGYFFEEWFLNVHVYAGYALSSLLIFRLIWGFIGSYYSRFRNFPLSLGAATSHLKDLIVLRSREYAGHNPVGAWMIVFLLSTLCLISLTGLIVWGGQENNGPLASMIGYSFGEIAEEVHESMAGLLMSLIAIHIAGVVIETRFFKHNVIKAMLSGRKDLSQSGSSTVAVWQNMLGLAVLLTVFAGFFYWANAATPAKAAISLNQTYVQECSDCHSIYHPSLRSEQSWQAIMAGLNNHYGENASLDDQTRNVITDYLAQNAANHFDSEVAHKIGRIDTQSQRMTDTRYWQKKHDDIASKDFLRPEIGSKVNCSACHQDAETGRFDDDQIKLPKGMKS